MKKLIVAVILAFIFVKTGYKTQFTLLDYFSGEYSVYTQNEMRNSIDLGFCFVSDSKQDKAKIIGESLVIKNFEVGSALKTLDAKVVKTEIFEDGMVVIYAYSTKISTTVEIEKEKVNLQIAERETDFVIGWPLILGGF